MLFQFSLISQDSLSDEVEAGSRQELLNDGRKVSISLLGELELSADGLEDVRVLGAEVLEVELLKLTNLVGLNLVEVATDTGVEDANLLLRGHRDVLLLLDELSELLTTVEQLLGSGIEVRAELSESSDLTVLGELELHGTGDLLGCLVLGSGSYTGHRETDGDGRALSLVEELGLHYGMGVGEKIVG